MKDTLGRENRKIPDRRCNECTTVYRPKRLGSKYCSRICSWKNNGKNHGQNVDHETWWLDGKGYITGRVWRNGKCIKIGQHRWIMEQHLGRPLGKTKELHHINGIKTDNRIENLEFMEHGKHTKNHSKGRKHKHGYKLNLTDQERKRRADWMRSMRQKRRDNS